MHEPLFFSPTAHEKVAGYRLPGNPRLWQSEIIRHLKSQHPYLPLDSSEIDIRKVDAEKGAAIGSIVLSNEIAIPVIIKRPHPGADPELSPMDVFFHKGRYNYLDPEAIKALTHTPQVGEPEKGNQAVGGNPYVGDMTGDATPMEYSGQASPFAGPYDGVKVSSLMYKVAGEVLDRATLFGTTGAVAGGIKGALTSKGKAQQRAIEATKDALLGALAGSVAGASSAPVSKLLKVDKKQQQAIKKEVKKELDKLSEYGLTARLCKEAYLDPNDLSNFRRLMATSPHITQGSGGNFKLIEIVSRQLPEYRSPFIVKNPNMLQIYQRDGIVYIKFSGSPETKTSKHELKQIIGDRFNEVMSKLRSGQVHMEHDGVQQVTWDVKRPSGEAKQITRDGLYAVRTAEGSNVVGMVCPSMIDVDGKTLPLKLFVTPEGYYATANEMFGIHMASRHRLPSQVPASGQTGVFVNYIHGTPIATIPMQILAVNTVEKRTFYIVRDPITGKRFTLSPVSGVQGIEVMHVVDEKVKPATFGQVYFIPGDSEWVSLKTPVKLADSADELKKLSSVDDSTHVTYTGGQWNIEKTAIFSFVGRGVKQLGKWATKPGKMLNVVDRSHRMNVAKHGKWGGRLQTAAQLAPGAVTGTAGLGAAGYGVSRLFGSPKVASYQNLDAPEAREILASMGMDLDGAQRVMEIARESDGLENGVKIAGLHDPEIQEYKVIRRWDKVPSQADESFIRSLRPGSDLIKSAAESSFPETLDALLSLEFITPQNLRYFTDNLSDFEDVVSRLAALLVSVRLGMPHVEEQPVKDALEGLSNTVNKLKILKSAMDNKRVSGKK